MWFGRDASSTLSVGVAVFNKIIKELVGPQQIGAYEEQKITAALQHNHELTIKIICAINSEKKAGMCDSWS